MNLGLFRTATALRGAAPIAVSLDVTSPRRLTTPGLGALALRASHREAEVANAILATTSLVSVIALHDLTDDSFGTSAARIAYVPDSALRIFRCTTDLEDQGMGLSDVRLSGVANPCRDPCCRQLGVCGAQTAFEKGDFAQGGLSDIPVSRSFSSSKRRSASADVSRALGADPIPIGDLNRRRV